MISIILAQRVLCCKKKTKHKISNIAVVDASENELKLHFYCIILFFLINETSIKTFFMFHIKNITHNINLSPCLINKIKRTKELQLEEKKSNYAIHSELFSFSFGKTFLLVYF